MKLLDRYIIKDFFKYFCYCLFSIVTLSFLLNLLIELSNGKLKELGWTILINNVAAGIPPLVETVTPFSTLFATFFTFAGLSKTSEVVAMKAAGVSLAQMTKPIFLAGLAICLLTYANQSYFARWLGSPSQLESSSKSKSSTLWRITSKNLYWFSGVSKTKRVVKRAIIYQIDPEFQTVSKKQIPKLSTDGEQWKFENQTQRAFQQKKSTFTEIKQESVSIKNFPEIFEKELIYPKYYPLFEIYRSLQRKKREGVNTHYLELAFFQKISAVLSIPLMVILILPFSLFSARDSKLGRGILLCVIFGFTYGLLDQAFIALSNAKLVVSWISAFGSFLVFLSLAIIVLLLKKE